MRSSPASLNVHMELTAAACNFLSAGSFPAFHQRDGLEFGVCVCVTACSKLFAASDFECDSLTPGSSGSNFH